MQVLSVDGTIALCERAGAVERIDLSLIDGVEKGDHVLVFLGRAIEALTPEAASQVAGALEALEKAQAGEPFEHLIEDLVNNEPTLPPHLQPNSGGSS